MFTNAEYMLAASVSSLPDYQYKSMVVSRFGTNNNGGIHCDGKIFTGYYKNWRELSKEDRKKVNAKRVRTGMKKQPKEKRGVVKFHSSRPEPRLRVKIKR